MTGRERMLMTLRFAEPDRPPHFETIFELVEDAFGLSFPGEQELASSRGDEHERALDRCADLYARIVEQFAWDAICLWHPWQAPALLELLPRVRGRVGARVLVGAFVGAATWALEVIDDYTRFALDLRRRPETIHARAREMSDRAIAWGQKLVEAGAELIIFPSDWAHNGGTFVSPRDFAEIVTPYLHRNVEAIRRAGALVMLHSDGDLMAVLDQILDAGAHALQSIDPMAGMDIREVKRRTHGRLALMGNVQCSLLQDGPAAAIAESARYCLTHGAPGGGYIFGSSNTIFRGLPLRHYELMLDAYRQWCGQKTRAEGQ